jgi:hypothetical protein
MFKCLWRLLLTLSLLLTLPMQGYAAARMTACDAVLAGALAGAGARSMAHDAGRHDMSAHHGDVHNPSPHNGLQRHAVERHGMQHDGMQHDGMQHDGIQGGTHGGADDGIQGGTHTAHGASCMGCTPCSPGAAPTCMSPITSPSVSLRVIPTLLVAPASPDLALPERPPQAFLA